MGKEVFGMTRQTAQGVQNLLRYHHANKFGGPGDFLVEQQKTFVRITGTSDSGKTYDGVPCQLDIVTGEWQEFDDCKVKDPFNEPLTVDAYYFCQCVGYKDEDLYFVPCSSGRTFFPAKITERGGCCGSPCYKWIEQKFETCGEYSDGYLQGKLNAQVKIDIVQAADSISVPMDWTLTITAATGGTFTLTITGHGTTSALAFDATASDIETALNALGGPTVAVTGPGPFDILVTSDFDTYTLTGDGTELKPKPDKVAYELNSLVIADADLPVYVWMSRGGGKAPQIHITQISTGDGVETRSVWHVWISDCIDGSWNLSYDGGGSFASGFSGGFGSAPIDWDAIASLVRTATGVPGVTVTGAGTAVSPWIVTAEDTDDDHTLEVEDLDLVGTLDYRFAYGGGGGVCVQVVTDVSCTDGALTVEKKWVRVVKGPFDDEDACH